MGVGVAEGKAGAWGLRATRAAGGSIELIDAVGGVIDDPDVTDVGGVDGDSCRTAAAGVDRLSRFASLTGHDPIVGRRAVIAKKSGLDLGDNGREEEASPATIICVPHASHLAGVGNAAALVHGMPDNNRSIGPVGLILRRIEDHQLVDVDVVAIGGPVLAVQKSICTHSAVVDYDVSRVIDCRGNRIRPGSLE